jgi:mannose PTS system EIID component
MKEIPDGVRVRMLLRSFLVQGSWNYETMIGTGFAFTLLPLLRYLYPTDVDARRSAMKRHAEIFNSHPYLATVAIGAVSRLEVDGTPPRSRSGSKAHSAVRSVLSGDRLVWTAWRPVSLLLGILLILAGAAWWLAMLVFLLVYNVFHIGLRVWGLRIGLEMDSKSGRCCAAPRWKP